MIKIQKAKTSDVMEIKALLYKTWMQTYSAVFSKEDIETVTSLWHDPNALKAQIENEKMLFLVAKDNDQIVGMLNTDQMDGDHINIQRIHVHTDHQRQGIGSMLLQEVERLGHKRIDLEVEENNARAIAFYEKHGFKKSGKKVFEVRSVTIPCFVMEKKFSSI